MSATKDIRNAIIVALQAAFPFKFVAGKIDPPVERGDIGCCFTSGKQELRGNVDLEQVYFTVRAMSGTRRPRGATRERDPSELEDWAELIETTISAVQTQLGGWYARVTAWTINHDLGMTEATIVVWQPNVFRTS